MADTGLAPRTTTTPAPAPAPAPAAGMSAPGAAASSLSAASARSATHTGATKRDAGAERAAALLLALGPDASAAVLRLMSPAAINGLAASARALQTAPADIVDVATREFVGEMESYGTGPLTRGIALQDIVEAALGDGAHRVLSPSQSAPRSPVVQSIVDAEADDIALLLRKEQVPTAALVLAMLPPDKSSAVIAKLPEPMRAPVVRAIFQVSSVSPDLVDDVLGGLAEQVQRFVKAGKRKKIDGTNAGLSILRGMSPDEQRNTVAEIEKTDGKLAETIRGKLVAFEDIAKLTRKEIQLFLQSVDGKLLAVALRGVGAGVTETILANMSQRAAESFREEMEGQGKLRLSQIESAQAELVKVVLRLAEEGKLTLPGQSEQTL